MEHKLVLGGEKYVPFARSRIAALRALGLPYASQKFDMGDAVVVVWIEPGQDYMRITGGVSVPLDSGVVRLPVDGYAAGKLYRPAGVAAYDAAFTQVSGKYLTNPQPGSDGQFDGLLQSLRGRILPSGSDARSFSPQLITNPDGSGGFIAQPDDTALAVKSVTARLCPPSVFTGRTRLYVQAMYGVWLHPDKKTTARTPDVVAGNYAAPFLRLTNYRGGGDKIDYPQPLDLTTNNGVFFDAVQGKHWLVEPPNQNSVVNLYPLVSTPAAETLRKYLRSDSKLVLSEADRTRLEAYVLAEALPDRQQVQTVILPTRFEHQPTNLGYGWHFNWSGTQAVFVKNTTFDQGSGQTAMVSNYFTLNVTASRGAQPESPLNFYAVVEAKPPVNWYSSRGLWSITSPNFIDKSQDKFLPKQSAIFECSAVFYAYFNKDELIECKIDVVNIPAGPTKQENAKYCSGVALSTCASIGFLDGFGKSTSAPQHYECTITVGGEAYGPAPTTHIAGGSQEVVNGKSGTPPASVPFNIGGTQNVPVGYPIGDSPFVYVTIFVSGNLGQFNQPWTMTCNEITTTFSITHRGELVAFSPVYDAEAFFVHANWRSTEEHTGVKNALGTAGFAYDNWSRPGLSGWEDPWTKYTHYGYPGAFGTVSSAAYSSSEDSVRLDKNKLHARGQAQDAIVNTSTFFADINSDSVDTATDVISNVGSSVVISSPALNVFSGMGNTGELGDAMAFVGWA